MKQYRLYIAGPMTGIEDFNFAAFRAAEKILTEAGYLVTNPADNGQGDHEWKWYVRMGIQQLLTCDGVAVLPGWSGSMGAQLEVHIAQRLDMPVDTVPEWVRLMEGES